MAADVAVVGTDRMIRNSTARRTAPVDSLVRFDVSTPASAPAAELHHVTVQLGGRTILDDISLRVESGEFVAVLGSNGAGKSTMLKAVLGLIRPSPGTISVVGRSPRRGRADVGYCPQVRTLDRETPLRARDLVGLGLDGHRWGLGGMPRRERDARVNQ